MSRAPFAPIPRIYRSATTTRLLVGILTPAIRATGHAPFGSRFIGQNQWVNLRPITCRVIERTDLLSRDGERQCDAVPSFRGPASALSCLQNGCRVLLDSCSPRQPLLAAISGPSARSIALVTSGTGAMPSTDLSSPF